MSEVQVRLHAVRRHVAFPVLIRIEGARVDIDVRIHILDGDPVAAGLEEFSDAGGDDALAQGRHDTARYEDKMSISHLYVRYNTGYKGSAKKVVIFYFEIFASSKKRCTFAIPFGNEREFLRPKPKGGSVKIDKKFIEKTERKVQASTEKL